MAAKKAKKKTSTASGAARKKTTTRPSTRGAGKPAATKKATGVRSRTAKVATTTPAAIASAQRCALAIAEAALDKKAGGVEIIDVAGKVDYADYVVVMSGTSDRQVAALARGIAEDVPRKTGDKCLGVEGLPGGSWVLMDFGDVVVHVFHADVRGYYDIESLWIDAARVPVPAG